MPSRKVIGLKLAVVAGLFSGLLLSRNLWVSTRSYPLTPVLPFLTLGFPFDYAVFAALLLLLILIAIAARPAKLICAFVALAVLWTLFDQSRWQPWFYQYVFMLAALGFWFANRTDPPKSKSALDACRLIVVCVYFWSGVQKLNPGFVNDIFPWMLAPLVRSLPAADAARLQPLALAVPLVEMGIALGLLTRKFRNLAVLAAVAMHSLVLASIGPWGLNYNNVVWPWNVVMIVSVGLLFWRANEVRALDVLWRNELTFQKLVLVLFALSPALSLVNRWDNYLSFALYAGNRNSAAIYMTPSVASRLPDDVQELVTEPASRNPPGPDALSITDWSWGTLNVPPYPEVRIFKNIGRQVCRWADNSSDVHLAIQGKTTWFWPAPRFVYGCADLSN